MIYRVFSAREGTRGQALLSLVAFNKKTQKAPHLEIELAVRRLRDWRSRTRATPPDTDTHRRRRRWQAAHDTAGTSQPTLARLETTAADTKLSTVERFANALG